MALTDKLNALGSAIRGKVGEEGKKTIPELTAIVEDELSVGGKITEDIVSIPFKVTLDGVTTNYEFTKDSDGNPIIQEVV